MKSRQTEYVPQPRSPIAEKIWKLVSEKHEFAPLSERSLKNLAKANEILKNEAIIIYSNHTSKNDAPVAIALTLSHLTNAKRLMAPAGMKHYDLKRDHQRDLKSALMLRALRILRIHIIPVVQHDDLDNYPEKKRQDMLRKLKNKANSLLKKAGGVYGITPEGTRSKETGKLLRARPGIGKVGKYAPRDIKYLPVGIVYKSQSEKPQVVVGEPESLGNLLQVYDVFLQGTEDEQAQQIADLLMFNLSRLLPEEIRGIYENFDI